MVREFGVEAVLSNQFSPLALRLLDRDLVQLGMVRESAWGEWSEPVSRGSFQTAESSDYLFR
jgi:hypothetical protein